MWIPVLKAIAANIVVMIGAFGFGTSITPLLPDSFSRQTKSICAMIGFILAIGIAMAVFSKLRPWPVSRSVAIFPAAIIAAVLVMTALSGLLEPAGDWNIDSVAYHLVGPKV